MLFVGAVALNARAKGALRRVTQLIMDRTPASHSIDRG